MKIITFNLHRGTGLVSKAIMLLTSGSYSHASVNFGENRYESIIGGGVVKNQEQKVNRSKVVKQYHIKVTNKNYSLLENWINDQVGKKYDYAAILSFISPLFHKPRIGYWYCSELAYVLYAKARGNLGNVDDQKVSPQLLNDILSFNKK
jgi:uncharacterized protein YycO